MRQDYKPTAHVVRMTAEGTVLAERDIITPLECFIEGIAVRPVRGRGLCRQVRQGADIQVHHHPLKLVGYGKDRQNPQDFPLV